MKFFVYYFIDILPAFSFPLKKMSKRKLQLLQALNHDASGLLWNASSVIMGGNSMPFTIAGMNTTETKNVSQKPS